MYARSDSQRWVLAFPFYKLVTLCALLVRTSASAAGHGCDNLYCLQLTPELCEQ